MKRFTLSYLVVFAVLLIMSCDEQVPELFSSCDQIGEFEIITEEERANTCILYNVYLYQNTHYTTCRCCLCDKVDIAIDCDGNELCKPFESGDFSAIKVCMAQFYNDAEYLFSVIN